MNLLHISKSAWQNLSQFISQRIIISFLLDCNYKLIAILFKQIFQTKYEGFFVWYSYDGLDYKNNCTQTHARRLKAASLKEKERIKNQIQLWFCENWNLCKSFFFRAIYASKIRNRSRIFEAIILMLMKKYSLFCVSNLHLKNALYNWCNANFKEDFYILYFCKIFSSPAVPFSQYSEVIFFFLMWHLYRCK